MSSVVEVSIQELDLYVQNPRLTDPRADQQNALEAIIALEPDYVLKQAEDIVAYGLDPISLLAVSERDGRKRRVVFEGNRRLTALRLLESPALGDTVLTPQQQKKLLAMHELFTANPIRRVAAVQFSEDSWRHWVQLKHTGRNDGAGVVPWGSDEQNRFNASGGARNIAGQALDFLRKRGVDVAGKDGSVGYATTLARLLSTPELRKRIGLDLQSGTLFRTHDEDAVAHALQHVTDALRNGKLKVGMLMNASQRRDYAKKLPKSVAVKAADVLPDAIDLNASVETTRAVKQKTTGAKKLPPSADRKRLIPPKLALSIPDPRINDLYIELMKVDLDRFTNVCSFGLRVFIELSCDHYIEQHNLVLKGQTTLGLKLQAVAADLEKAGKLTVQKRQAVNRIAGNATGPLSVSTFSMHQFVHNKHVFPQPRELKVAFDEVQPFLVALWP